jgi:hypothetical protein
MARMAKASRIETVRFMINLWVVGMKTGCTGEN